MNTQKLLTVVIGLQVLTVASQWLGQPSIVTPAMAQMPDAGSQRAAMLDELKGIRSDLKALAASGTTTAARVDKIAALLESGKVQVRAVSPDENKRPAAPAR